MQEQMSRNRILVEYDSKIESIVASCASNTLETKSRISILSKSGKILLKSSSFTELIPFVIIVKAMGFIQDQEILQMIGTESEIVEDVFLSFHDSVTAHIRTQNDALRYLSKRIKYQFKEYKAKGDNVALFCK